MRPSTSAPQTQSTLEDHTPTNEVILRWDPHGKFLRFNDGNKLVEHLMVNYSRAKTVYENSSNGIDYLEPHQTLTISGTEPDDDVVDRGRWDAFDFLAAINRRVRYIPDWGWVYEGMNSNKQDQIIDRYVDRVQWWYEQQEYHGLNHVEFIPLAKGLTTEHFRRAVDTFEELGVERIAMYGGQTPSITDLVMRIERAIDVFEPEGILVIGKQSEADVQKLPARVDGVAGLRNWKDGCNLTANGYSSTEFYKWYNRIKEALKVEPSSRQVSIQSSTQEEVPTNG